MLAAAATVFFRQRNQPALNKELKSLLDVAGRFAGRRNEIAHCTIATTTDKDTGEKRYILWPSLYNSKKSSYYLDPKYGMTSAEIMRFAAEFDKITHRASAICQQLSTLRKTHPQQAI